MQPSILFFLASNSTRFVLQEPTLLSRIHGMKEHINSANAVLSVIDEDKKLQNYSICQTILNSHGLNDRRVHTDISNRILDWADSFAPYTVRRFLIHHSFTAWSNCIHAEDNYSIDIKIVILSDNGSIFPSRNLQSIFFIKIFSESYQLCLAAVLSSASPHLVEGLLQDSAGLPGKVNAIRKIRDRVHQ